MPASPVPPSAASGVGAAHAPRWERRKESRPTELIAAALEVFVERGYAATRLDDVAARAGVSKGTLYLYFANKEELFKAVVRENIVTLLERFGAQIRAADAPAALLVEQFVRRWWGEFGATPLAGIAKLVLAEVGNFPEVARFFHDEVIRPNVALLGEIVTRGIASGEFRPVDVVPACHAWLAPLVLKALWRQSFERCGLDDAPVDPQRLLDTHVDLILAALAPRPA